jgi:cytoskeletal protein RodZ
MRPDEFAKRVQNLHADRDQDQRAQTMLDKRRRHRERSRLRLVWRGVGAVIIVILAILVAYVVAYWSDLTASARRGAGTTEPPVTVSVEQVLPNGRTAPARLPDGCRLFRISDSTGRAHFVAVCR